MENSKIDKYEFEALQEYLATHKFGASADYDFNKLYSMFASISIFSIEDIFLSPNRFKNFVTDNIDLIQPDGSILSKARILSLLDGKCKILTNKIKTLCGLTQQQFAEIVGKLSGTNVSILDVGAGDIPYSSILLGDTKQSVTTMDRRFELSPETLKRLNVDAETSYFTEGTDISKYDIVVGQRPCSAIEKMVKECVKQNKPYFIELCNCHIPPSKTPGKPAVWSEILPEIDSYVRFYGDYAFNLDATEAQVRQVIEDHEFFKMRERYFAAKLPLYNIPAQNIETRTIKSWSIDPSIYPAPDKTPTQLGE